MIPGFVTPGILISLVVDRDGNKFYPGIGTAVRVVEGSEAKVAGKSQAKAIVATSTGKVVLSERQESADSSDKSRDNAKGTCYTVNIVKKAKGDDSSSSTTPTTSHVSPSASSGLPKVGDYILARVSKLTSKQANVEILVVEGQGGVGQDAGLGLNGNENGIHSNPLSNAGSLVEGAIRSDLGEGFGGIIRSIDVRATERDKVKMELCFKPGDIVRAQVISLGDGANYYLSTAKNELGVLFARSKIGELMYATDWQTMACPVTGLTEERKCASPYKQQEVKTEVKEETK